MSVEGSGPSSKLAANKRTFVAACVMLAIGLIVAFVGGAIFFLWASWGVRHDIGSVSPDLACCYLHTTSHHLRATKGMTEWSFKAGWVNFWL